MSLCPGCGTTFCCGMADDPAEGEARSCWCMQLPRLEPRELVFAKDGTPSKCFCPDCLRQRKAALEVTKIG